MLDYGISAEQAFALLRRRWQQTATTLRALAAQLLAELGGFTPSAATVRRLDHLLLPVHERVGT